jgi:hypothetical protein
MEKMNARMSEMKRMMSQGMMMQGMMGGAAAAEKIKGRTGERSEYAGKV